MNTEVVALDGSRTVPAPNLYAYKSTPASASRLDAKFKTSADALADEATGIESASKDLTHRQLKFAETFAELLSEARRLDAVDRGTHNLYLQSVLEKAVGTTNPSIWSKWNTIGKEAKALLPYKDSLPPQRDSLYEIVLAKKAGKPVDQWVKKGRVTSHSSVRDVKELRNPKTAKHQGSTGNYAATVTLCFDSYLDAARLLESLMTSKGDFKVKANKPFTNALKSTLAPPDYQKVQGRVL